MVNSNESKKFSMDLSIAIPQTLTMHAPTTVVYLKLHWWTELIHMTIYRTACSLCKGIFLLGYLDSRATEGILQFIGFRQMNNILYAVMCQTEIPTHKWVYCYYGTHQIYTVCKHCRNPMNKDVRYHLP